VGVWVGNASGAPMRNVSGVSGAAPAWAEIMRALHRELRSRPPAAPAGVVARRIAYEQDIEPRRGEWFLASNAPVAAGGVATIRLQSPVGKPRILAPQDASLIAWDPDIPAGSQGVLARYDGAADEAQWVLNGEVLGSGAQRVVPLRAGHNRLVLRGADGAVLDEVAYEVRGMPVSAAGPVTH